MKILHHNDLDGRCAGHVVSLFTGNKNYKEDYFECDYTTNLNKIPIQKDEEVYIVDFSFSKNTYTQFLNLLNKTENVVWIDHHASSLDLLKEHPELNKRFKGLVSNEYSGAALAYMYFYDKEFNKIPSYIQYVSDYDTWSFEFGEDTEYFKLGMDCLNTVVGSDVWDKLDVDSNKDDYGFLSRLVEDGKIIKKYLDAHYKEQIESDGYEITIPFNNKFYRALVLNGHGNSWVFSDKFNSERYDLYILWNYDGTIYNYSMYSNKDRKGYFNVQKLAEKYGGGGHENASGIQSKKKIW